jgi:hypothetical protein
MGLGDIFGGGSGDRSGAFNDYAQFMGNAANRYNPWIDAGNRARDMNEAQYARIINNPNAVQDQVAAGFSMSPYQKFMEDEMTRRMNNNAANTGMLGTSAANRSLMDDLLKMTGQFQDTYINRGMNTYNRGLQGNDFLSQLGMSGLNAQDNLLEQQAAAQLKGNIASQDANTGMWGDILGLAGGVAGNFLGGPMGAKLGSSIGQSIGGGSSGSFSPGVNAAWSPNGSGGYTPMSMPAGGWGASLT